MSAISASPSNLRVENSFKQLAAAAQALNTASDDLAKVIRHLDATLKKLALEITVWVQVNGTADETQYWANEVGYVKFEGKWCIALREVTGYLQDNSDETEQVWIFSDAPRALRVEAVDKIPDLLEKLLQQAQQATENIERKIEQAAELTYMVANMAPNTPAPAPQTWHRPVASLDGVKSNSEQGGQKNRFLTARFQQSSPAESERPVAANPVAANSASANSTSAPLAGATPSAAAFAGGSPAASSGARLRETDPGPAERPAVPARVLPAERTS